MALISSAKGVMGAVGFVAAVLGIGEWTGYWPGWGDRDKTQAIQPLTGTGGVTAPDPNTDEGRLHQLLAQNIICDGVSFEVTSFERKDTAAADTSSGQPATYLAAFVQFQQGETPLRIEAIGNGRGPGGESQAFTRLLDAVQQQVEDTFSECSKG